MTLDAAIACMLAVVDPPDEDAAHEIEVALRLGACRQRRARTADVAKRVGRSRDALRKRMKRLGLPSTGKLITWGRLLAMMLLWRAGYTLDDAAAAGGYDQGSTLSGMMRHHSGLAPTEWSGDVDELCLALYTTWWGAHQRGEAVAAE